MTDYDSLIEKVKSYDTSVDVDFLRKACDFSKEAHGTQKRASGEPYYYHPLEVANILADMRLDSSSIVTALLHDTVEDTDVTLATIKEEFGNEIKTLVDGVTKLAKIEYQSDHVRQAENFRKLFVAMSEDIRVLLVKLADRLHNMRTLHYVKSPKKRLRVAHETIEIYAPLAERIGMQQMKNELQDLSFAELHPEIRDSILSRLEYLRDDGRAFVKSVVSEIKSTLEESSINIDYVDVYGREKTPCSIWLKMERKNVSFEQLSDIMAFRIITKDLENCYKALGVIHTAYQTVPDSFRDFISTPKSNGYRSLHTVVIGPDRKFIEVQIRTKEMHEIAEFGVAAHWSYKQDCDYKVDGRQYKWVRELLYILEHASDSAEFLENTKLEMYYDQVFCFTPKGELVALPKGATPVDFAFDVHSRIGFNCKGAKINGRIVPLRTQLHNGDQVEIITSEEQVPSPAWEKFVVTAKAKSEIRRFVRGQKRQEYIKLGQSIASKTLKEGGVSKASEKDLAQCAKRLGKQTVEDLYAAVGEGSLSSDEFFKAFFPDKKPKQRRKNPLSLLKFSRDRKKSSDSVPIEGLTPGVAVYFAECCHPIPGDAIVGVIVTGKGITIHTSDCSTLEGFTSTPERLIDVSWGKHSHEDSYVGRLRVVLVHESGSLAALTNIVSKQGGNIFNLKIVDRASDFFEIIVDIGVRGASHLNNIVTSLRSDELIQSVRRNM